MNKKIIDAMSDIDFDYVEDARPRGRRRFGVITVAAAAVLALALGLGTVARMMIKPRSGDKAEENKQAYLSEGAAAKPTESVEINGGNETVDGAPQSGSSLGSYFVTAPTDTFMGGTYGSNDGVDEYTLSLVEEMRSNAVSRLPDMSGFTKSLITELLKNREGMNTICSPVSAYLSLMMLADISEGEPREKLMSCLKAADEEQLRKEASDLLYVEIGDSGIMQNTLLNSLWLNDDYKYDNGTIVRFARIYNAFLYKGSPEDGGYLDYMRNWLAMNDADASAKNEDFPPQMELKTLSVAASNGAWARGFDKAFKGIFHAPNGNIECDMMEKSVQDVQVYRGSGFTAVADDLLGYNAEHVPASLWLLLPDEGVSVEQMLRDGGLEFICSDMSGGERSNITLTAPKLDLEYEYDLTEIMEGLGVSISDMEISGIVVDKAHLTEAVQTATFKTDENGLGSPAAVASVKADANAPTAYGVTLDRPFAFALTGISGTPLLFGVVNYPGGN